MTRQDAQEAWCNAVAACKRWRELKAAAASAKNTARAELKAAKADLDRLLAEDRPDDVLRHWAAVIRARRAYEATKDRVEATVERWAADVDRAHAVMLQALDPRQMLLPLGEADEPAHSDIEAGRPRKPRRPIEPGEQVTIIATGEVVTALVSDARGLVEVRHADGSLESVDPSEIRRVKAKA